MNTIQSIEDFLSRDSARLADSVLPQCPLCGRAHRVPFGDIHLGRGAVQQVPALSEKILGRTPRRAVLIYDHAIEEIIIPAVLEPLQEAGMAVEPHGMAAEPGHLLDSGVINGDKAAEAIGPTADLLIAAGSGVISDLTKWIATRLQRPFLICGTAPSMNGYTSITATITENDVKVSKFLNPADAVLLDVDILSGAPLAMIHSGMGDLAARAVASADWKLSQRQRGTYFCPLPYLMTANNEDRYLAAAAGIGRREPAAIELLSEAVLLSGLSMTVVDGETSPSSGAEHVISHFWDLLVHLRHLPKNFHGTQVGIGTLIMLNAYAYLRTIDPGKIDPQAILRRRPSLEALEAETRARFGSQAEGFLTVARKKRIADADLPAYLRKITQGWEAMWADLDPFLAPVERIERPFKLAGVPVKLESVHRSLEHAREALLYGNIYRPRYTLLDLLWELGLFPDAVDEILARSGVI